MNLYNVIALILLIIIVGHIFNLGPAIEQLANRIADIPLFEDKGGNPALYNLAVRMMYLIALIGIIKIIFSRKKDE